MSPRYIFHPFVLLSILFLIHIALWWPGVMTPDSHYQYASAVSAAYSDHHPFIMSFVWRYLDKLYPGPGLMLVLHLALLYGSTLFLMQCMPKHLKYWALAFPLIPGVYVYSGYIWKDVGYAFCCLLVGTYLARLTVQGQRLTILSTILLLGVLVYGTMVKFQAQYIVPWLILWMALNWANYQWNWRCLGIAALLGGLLYGGITGVRWAGPPVQENHSWQFVKFFDLAAISLDTQRCLIPSANRTKHFSMQEMAARFDSRAVDPYVYSSTPLFRKGTTETERTLLWKTWAQAVIEHPLKYLKHRMRSMILHQLSLYEFIDIAKSLINQFKETRKILIKYAISFIAVVLLNVVYYVLAWKIGRRLPKNIPLLCLTTIGMSMIGGLYLRAHIVIVLLSIAYCIFAWKTRGTLPKNLPLLFLKILGLTIIGGLFIRHPTAHITVIFFSMIYGLLAWKTWGKLPESIPLFFLNIMGLTMVSLLFIFSMASTPRYTYVTACLFHSSHYFAWCCLQAWLGRRLSCKSFTL